MYHIPNSFFCIHIHKLWFSCMWIFSHVFKAYKHFTYTYKSCGVILAPNPSSYLQTGARVALLLTDTGAQPVTIFRFHFSLLFFVLYYSFAKGTFSNQTRMSFLFPNFFWLCTFKKVFWLCTFNIVWFTPVSERSSLFRWRISLRRWSMLHIRRTFCLLGFPVRQLFKGSPPVKLVFFKQLIPKSRE